MTVDGGSAPWEPPSLASEGFVHLSHADQLAGTLALHFANCSAVVLLEVDRVRVAADVRLEPSRGRALFPHLYRALDADDVLQTWTLERQGGWVLPKLG
ncbi:MAG: DUF952 domain-containing protein [bacterium]|nr:DUF952 domain-containing protein [bacterium]